MIVSNGAMSTNNAKELFTNECTWMGERSA